MIIINYLLTFGLALAIVLLSIPFLKKLAVRIDFVDKPVEGNERKIHKEPVPFLASIAIFAAFFTAYSLFVRRFDREFFAVLAGSVLVMGIGMLDDWYKSHGREMGALPKFIVQILAACIVYRSGIVFVGFHNPFTNLDIVLPGFLQFLLTIMWIFGVTTVINFSDGIDGLAGGLSAISAMTLFVVALAKGQNVPAVMAIALVGAGVGYFRFNKHPARIYMGDAGATFMGFILAIIALDGAFKQATVLSLFIPILALGVPIFDSLLVVLRRFLKGKPVFKADATQAHYRLMSYGLSQKQVVAFLCLLNLCFCLTSIILLLLKV